MGVNLNVYLPLDVQDRHVASVLGVLAGLPAKYETSRGGYGRSYGSTEVKGVRVDHCNLTGMSDIVLTSQTGMVDGEGTHFAYFHYCARTSFGKRKIVNLLGPPSTAFWIALSRRAVHFLGGLVVYNDCAASLKGNSYRSKRHCPVDRHGLIPDDAEPWTRYHKALAALTPITVEDMIGANRYAAYKLSEKENVNV